MSAAPPSPGEFPPREPLLVERLVPGGAGLCRWPDGRVAFAARVAPGDRLRVTAFREKRQLVEVTAFELVEASPERVEPPCPHARDCGGCDWLHLGLGAQRLWKGELVREALRRTAGVALAEAPPVLAAGEPLGYRRRVRWHVGRADSGVALDAAKEPGAAAEPATDSSRLDVGFFAEGTRRLVAIPFCPVTAPPLDEAFAALRVAARALPGSLASFDEVAASAPPEAPQALGNARSAARRDASAKPVALHFVPRGPSVSAASRALLTRLAERYAVSLPGEPAFLDWPLGELQLSVPASGFTQANWDVNLRLVAAVVEGARARAALRFADLYCGAGNFALPLLAAGLRGLGVERSGAAIAGARRGARRAGLDETCWHAEDAVSAAWRLAKAREQVDLALVDPPRTGARELVAPLLALAPAHIAWIGCDPVTLARDVKGLVEGGYRLDEVAVFDMFPGTHHSETLAWLARPAR